MDIGFIKTYKANTQLINFYLIWLRSGCLLGVKTTYSTPFLGFLSVHSYLFYLAFKVVAVAYSTILNLSTVVIDCVW